MGAFELQVFVSLVVILGAAFVALVCDFLKGNNEQLREVNIELRVRTDEQVRREQLLEKTQRQVAETATLSQLEIQKAWSQRVAAPRMARPVASSSLADPRSAGERGKAAGPGSQRTQAESVESWAKELLARKTAEAASAASVAEPEPAVGEAPPAKSTCIREILGRPADPEEYQPRRRRPSPAVAEPGKAGGLPVPGVSPVSAPAPIQSPGIEACYSRGERETARPGSGLTPLLPPEPVPAPESEVPEGLPLPVERVAETPRALPELAAPAPVDRAFLTEIEPLPAGRSRVRETAKPLLAPHAPALPLSHYHVERVEGPPEANAAAAAEAGPAVEPVAGAVRIRVIHDESALGEPSAAPQAETSPAPASTAPARVEAAVSNQSADPWVFHTQDLPMPPIDVAPLSPEAEPAAATVAAPTQAAIRTELRQEARRNVVEMPAPPALRNAEPARAEAPAPAELELPGGLHEANALGMLLASPDSFTGLVITVSLVDHARLCAEHGRPEVDQMMTSVSRTVQALGREQDFTCRSADDEFALIFPRENGAAAQRRISQVSERLWDFQLRLLGQFTVLFSWGASEANAGPLALALAEAREQMQQTARTRASSSHGRSRRRAVNG